MVAAPFAAAWTTGSAEPTGPGGSPAARGSWKSNFRISGTYLNAAYTHPLPLDAAAAMRAWSERRADPDTPQPSDLDARPHFAKLINAPPEAIAAVPSTSYAESFVAGTLGLKQGKGKVVTDILHFDGSLYTYQRLAERGVRLTILPMTAEGRIDPNQMEAAVDGDTTLVAISLVSMVNGFEHDLKQVCDIAHRKGAKVYVDAIQGAGAVPIDVQACGVDFLACSSFKWLMGDFGFGFLYVRPDLLPHLQRPEFGYHQIGDLAYHAFPGDPPGRDLFDSKPNDKTAEGYFEVGSLGTAAEVAVSVSLDNINTRGVASIQAARQPLIERLRHELSPRFRPMTPPDSRSGIITFEAPKAREVLHPKLQAAQVNIQTYKNRFRVSPSVYNDMDDIDRLLDVLKA